MRQVISKQQFIEKANEAHNGFYDYSQTKYVKRADKIDIICPVHGLFTQRAGSHLMGHGCSQCKKAKLRKRKKSLERFIEQANKVHNSKYDYFHSVYKGDSYKIQITCKIHGDFWQRATTHLQGSGCPKCAKQIKRDLCNKLNQKVILTTKLFIKRANKVHNNKYDYSQTHYVNVHTPVTIICKTHGIFIQLPHNHLYQSNGCPKCSHCVSKEEEKLANFIKRFVAIETNNHKLIKPYEIDIWVPSKKLAIEYNGLRWHTEERGGKYYHQQKVEMCEQQGIHLIQIFEDEWLFKTQLIKSRLKNLLGINKRIYARKCSVKEITNLEQRNFMQTNHLQGPINALRSYALQLNGKNVAVMSFGSERIITGHKSQNNVYELLRYCCLQDVTIVGGASRLLAHFISDYSPQKIISYADRRWTNDENNVYNRLGFSIVKKTVPNYSYYIGKQRYSRYKFRKNILIKQGFSSLKSEHEIMLGRGYKKIFDAGHLLFEKEIS